MRRRKCSRGRSFGRRSERASEMGIVLLSSGRTDDRDGGERYGEEREREEGRHEEVD